MDLNQALAACRAFTYDEPNHQTWTKICHVLDQCSHDTQPLIIDYVRSHTDHWPLPTNPFHIQISNEPVELIPGEAPPHWRTQIIRGEDSPKFQVLKILNLSNHELGWKKDPCKILQCSLTNLQVLILQNNPLIPDHFYQQLLESNALPNLTHLDLSSWRKTMFLCADPFNPPEIRLTSLTHLNLSNNFFESEKTLLNIIQSPAFHNLKSLNLQGISIDQNPNLQLSQTALDALSTAFKSMPKLEELDLSMAVQPQESWEKLFSSPHLAQLTSLRLGHSSIRQEDFQKLAENPALSNLKTLEAPSSNLTDQALQSLATSPHLKSLTSLNLKDNKIGQTGIQALLKAPWIHQLSQLNLDNNHQLNQTTLAHLYGSKNLSALQHIAIEKASLSGNKVIQAIAKNTALKQLKTLKLSTEQASNQTLTNLAQSPALQNLQHLYLERQTPHPPKIKKAFANSPTLPQTCKIEFQDLNPAIRIFKASNLQDFNNTRWEKIYTTLDQCAPEFEHEALHYLQKHTTHWTIPPHTLDINHHNHAPGVAPAHWIQALIAEEDHPKFNTIRILNLQNVQPKLTGQKAIKIIRSKHLQNLKAILLRGIHTLSGNFFKQLLTSDFPNLTHLGLSGGTFKPIHAKAFAAPNLSLTSLTHLKLDQARFQNENTFQNFVQSRALHSLKHLTLHHSRIHAKHQTLLPAPCLDTLTQALTKIRNLEHLEITQSFSEEARWHHLLAHPNLKNLKRLNLSQNHIDTEGIKALTTNPQLANLERLNLSGCQIPNHAFHHLTSTSVFQNIHHIEFDKTLLNRQTLQALLHAPWLPQLNTLNLDNASNLTPDDLSTFYRSPNTKNLTSISLYNPLQSTETLLQTLQRTTHLENLSSLTLCTDQISNHALLSFAKNLPFPKLEHLQLIRFETHHPDHVIEAFHNSVPENCDVHIE